MTPFFPRIRSRLSLALGRQTLVPGHVLFPDDVFLVSYPRSGSAWLRFLVANLRDPARPVTLADLESRVPDIHAHTSRQLLRLSRPRFIKSHSGYDPRYRRVVLLVRDPRDVVLSYHHYLAQRRRLPGSGSLDDLVAAFVAGGVDSYGCWGENVGSWLGAREDTTGFLLLRYEDLHARPEPELARLAGFLSLPAGPDDVALAIERSAAPVMRRLEAEEILARGGFEGTFIRRGLPGAWRSELPPSHATRIEQAWPRLLRTLGYR